ncbi:MAG: hypothetical protein GWM98_04600 [Nitrospinaceae bacterium]|nr:hypothetical protein [Deltaproteobacteria bacterium]NIY14199.1 hypothetical protein [Nitrospinaceae bacterium]
MDPLTEKQAACLQAIKTFHRIHGYAPSQSDLMRALGRNHKRSIQQTLAILKRKGAVDWAPGVARSIRAID